MNRNSVSKTSKLGFTAIEVLAATALASMLMVAVLGVLAGIAQKEKLLEREGIAPMWQDRLLQKLRVDLEGALSIRSLPNELVLMGVPEGSVGHVTWLPGEVFYRIVEIDSNNALVRGQRSLITANTETHLELVCFGVDTLRIDSAMGSAGREPQPLRDGPVPPRIRLVLKNEHQVVLDRRIVID